VYVDVPVTFANIESNATAMDWIALTTLLHILPFIYSSSNDDDQRERLTAITTNYRAVEKYQLLGGESETRHRSHVASIFH
jgi:hypothetical protein